MSIKCLNLMKNLKNAFIFLSIMGGACLPLKASEYERVGIFSEQDLRLGLSASLRRAKEIWISPGMGERMVNPSGNDPVRNEDDRVRLYEGRRKIFSDLDKIVGGNSSQKVIGSKSERILDWSMIFDDMNLTSALIRGFSQEQFSRKVVLILERVNWDHGHSSRVLETLLEKGVYFEEPSQELSAESLPEEKQFFAHSFAQSGEIKNPALSKALQKKGFPSFSQAPFSFSLRTIGQSIVPCLRKITK